mgnify:FL=1
MNDQSTQDRQDPGGEGADEELLSLLPRLILTDLGKSDHTLGGNNCGNSSGRLNGGEQKNEDSLKRTDPATTAHRAPRLILLPALLRGLTTSSNSFPISLRGVARNSKNVGDDSIGGNSQKDENSDDGTHLGSSRPKRLGYDDAERHSEEQQTRAGKADERFQPIRTVLGGTPPRSYPLTDPQQLLPPGLRNLAAAQPCSDYQDADDDTSCPKMENGPPDQDTKSNDCRHSHQESHPGGPPRQSPTHQIRAANHGRDGKQKNEEGRHSPSPPPPNPSRSFWTSSKEEPALRANSETAC